MMTAAKPGRSVIATILAAALVLAAVAVTSGATQAGQRLRRLPGGGKRAPLTRPRARANPNNRDRQPAVRNAERRQRMQQEVMRRLNLSEEQQVRMRAVRRGYDNELVAAGRRVRFARRSLDEAIMRQQLDEAEVNHRSNELADAQASLIKVQSRMWSDLRKVLTPEQVVKFNQLEREMLRRERRNRLEMEQDENPPGQQIPPDPGHGRR
jgi:Spy/CpxP family protein refolding chaperone